MQTLTAFSLQTPSWWIAIAISLLLHVVLIFNYQSENTIDNIFDAPTELEISLNKYSAPQAPPEMSQKILQKKPQPITAPSSPPSEKLPEPKAKKLLQPKVVKPKLAPPMQSSQGQSVEKTSHQVASKTVVKSAPANTRDMLKIKADYLAKLAMWLNQHKRYPAVARRRGQEGEISVRFSINADGKLLSHEIVSPAEHASLNAAVVKMLNAASPMPAIPVELRNGKTKFEYTIPVLFKLTGKS